ncbi:MAG: hypothetical protein GY945_04300 [Rhodobacteraceae bacterium]|nr:hypothetical protein [Paracoccaceae bacterium]
MTQTRGRKSASAVNSGSGLGRGVRISFDRQALEQVWIEKVLLPPSGLVEAILEIAADQDAREATDLNIIDAGSSLLEAIKQVEKSATRLQKDILCLRSEKDGETHLYKWLINFSGTKQQGKSATSYVNYPDRLLDAMLAELANAIGRHYRTVSVTGHWHQFICRLKSVFERFGVDVQASDGTLFNGVLVELDRQFPGLSFPPETVNTGRRKYISRALGSGPIKGQR